MSSKSNHFDEQSVAGITACIKLEQDSDDELIEASSMDLSSKSEVQLTTFSSTNPLVQPVTSTYKGKIEVTSKGRRKIFDGVRWQILCRRPDCRKQTNKKSLCITHYKEEYERSSNANSWSQNLSSFEIFSYDHRRRPSTTMEEQNSTITTSNMIDTDDQYSLNGTTTNDLSGQIKLLHNGRRLLLKDRKWYPLCKYDSICQNLGKYEYLCLKHFQLTQEKRRHGRKLLRPMHRPNSTKSLADLQISSSSPSVLDQFDINSDDHIAIDHESSKTSKHPGAEFLIPSVDHSSLDDRQEKSIQTDLTIPICCRIYQKGHSVYSSCTSDKCTSSMISCPPKAEPQYDDSRYS